jgi:predicted acetyltransferase
LTADGDTALVGNRRSLQILTALSGDICTRVLDRMLLTCAIDNEPSHRVILANGGVPDGQAGGEDRFWISLGRARHS